MPLPRLSRTGLAVLALAAIAALWLGWRAWQGTPVDVASAAATRLKQTVVVSGRVLTPAKVEIGATITGRVTRVNVDDGDPVKADQVLVELERSELAAALAQAAAAEQAAATRIAQWRDVGAPQVREQLVQAEVTYRNVERDAARQEQLFRQGFIGEARVDEARRAVTVAKSQLDTARASAAANTASGVDRRLLEDQLAQARAARETAAARLAQTTLRAPAAGVVLDRSVEPGDIVQPGKRLLTLALAGAARLTALIDEKNLGLLKVGQTAVVSADAYPADRFRAELVYVAPGIDVQRGTVEARFAVPAPPPYLRADMTVSIEVEVADRADAVVVPAAAVREPQSDAPWVLVVDGGRARRVPVKLGARTASQIEIREGAAPGAQVILTPGIAAGERVRAAR
jgi:HlyD family secretion protein